MKSLNNTKSNTFKLSSGARSTLHKMRPVVTADKSQPFSMNEQSTKDQSGTRGMKSSLGRTKSTFADTQQAFGSRTTQGLTLPKPTYQDGMLVQHNMITTFHLHNTIDMRMDEARQESLYRDHMGVVNAYMPPSSHKFREDEQPWWKPPFQVSNLDPSRGRSLNHWALLQPCLTRGVRRSLTENSSSRPFRILSRSASGGSPWVFR